MLGSTGSVRGGIGWHVVALGHYCLILGGTWSVWGGTGWYLVVMGLDRVVLVDI